jgi:serine/threonine protein kinase
LWFFYTEGAAGRASRMPLHKAIANLSLDVTLGSTSGAADGGPPAFGREDSFDVSGTSTFTAGELQIHGETGLAGLDSGIVLADLDREQLLGRGASGKVMLMRHKKTKERYALKELNSMADQDVRHQAINELKIAQKHAAASGGHLVALVDAYYDEGKICILMEYCDGGSLVEQLQFKRAGVRNFPLGPVTLQILQGLRHMHREMKQVHRDLKPANILLNGDGVVKLSDFGVSKQLDSTGQMAQTQVGSTAYMAPERLKGDEYSFSSDVWAVGIIVLEALLGEHPFPVEKHKNFVALFTAICSGKAPPPPEGTPSETAEFVTRCLNVDPRCRPSVDELFESTMILGIKGDARQSVLAWLMKSAAKAMAMKAIATSNAPAPAPQQ